ncbi:Uncharacterised protein [Achromobacter sp. 2789STDY5608633]|jgi:hypothetical protein|uniref:hypothetical protein n=1 Tax=Achromobacter sp. 2789STDY5608633 TaxID=1806501 RepID=UPI0006C5E1DD|nr:hypothetical protein [Achromobacter sp. 2789STDY5608633]CUJ51443.1 Uncharacterised protein [Achromobacter sp. 2789STDY5608633]
MEQPSNHQRRVLIDQTITRSLWIDVEIEGESPSNDDFKERAEELAKSIDFANSPEVETAVSIDAVAVEAMRPSSARRPRP